MMVGWIASHPGTDELATPDGQVAGSARSRPKYSTSFTPANSLVNSGTLNPVL